eukprot:TRINITY_DN6680_c0_g1_i1.p1 TRINITY_DN6680_c0_g1~~TRINITY_DN6680_c0_g1_i1.p1  ORF type:complete len:252 (-),score=29.97 TRINITY_DN6680_c0_g1_i1:121-876(-)
MAKALQRAISTIAWRGSPYSWSLIAGLDDAGKTTLLYLLVTGKVVQPVKTIGFNCETIVVNNFTLHTYDVGGDPRVRPLWRHYVNSRISSLIFVVDASRPDRFTEARDTLQTLLSYAKAERLGNIPVLVFANKQDLPGACCGEIVAASLELFKLESPWHVCECSALSPEPNLWKRIRRAVGANAKDRYPNLLHDAARIFVMVAMRKGLPFGPTERSLAFLSTWDELREISLNPGLGLSALREGIAWLINRR